MSHSVIKEQGLELDVIPSPVQSDAIAVALTFRQGRGHRAKRVGLGFSLEKFASDRR
jgi:hypothetical protein